MDESTHDVPFWLTDKFLENSIKDGYKNQDVSLVDKEVTFDTGVGDHYASTMYKVKVTVKLDDTIKDIHLIIKAPPKLTTDSDDGRFNIIFETETHLLARVSPALTQILQNKTQDKTCDFVAKCFLNKDAPSTVIVVEDLTALGFKMAKRHSGLDLDHCLLVMKTLARFHAASVALRQKDPNMINSLPEHLFTKEETAKGFSRYIKTTCKNLSDIVKSWPKGEQYSERLLKRADSLMQDYQRLLEWDHSCFNVLIHGDMWVNNMLFRYDTDGKVTEVKFVDFQLSCYNAAVIDILYFIYTSPTEDVRVHHTDSLLREYHSELCDTLRQLGLKNSTFPYEKLLEDYEKKMLHGMYTSLIIFPIVAAEVEDAFNIESTFADGVEDVSIYRRLANPYVQQVYKRILPFFAEKGLF